MDYKSRCIMNTPIIIGAGVAGLATANYFVDNNVHPIIIEADEIGRNKICGEFYSPEVTPILHNWNIPLIMIQKTNFIIPQYNYSYMLPSSAGSIARSKCELLLANRAQKLGAKIFTKTSVTEIINAKNETSEHIIKLSTGEIFKTHKLIIASGKLPFLTQQKKLTPRYVGIKAHFTNITIPNELYMCMINGAYMGITYVDDSTVNICCLAKKNLVDKFKNIDEFMLNFFNSNKVLKNIFKNAKMNYPWITGFVPNFGKKTIPNWPNTYFIGDAAATIFPASGNGLAMGITSGIMAAKYIINNKNNFKKNWYIRYNKRLYFAKILNSLFLRPKIAKIGFRLATYFPILSKTFYRFTRD